MRTSALVLGFDVDGGVLVSHWRLTHLLCRGRRGCGWGGGLATVLDAILEALDGTTQIGADIFELLGTKTSTTMSKTISQCQTEKEPMKFS